MSKTPRKQQKIFAENASDVGQFGSRANATPVLTKDLDTIQALSNYLNGWSAASIGGDKLPPIEDMNALFYLTTTQLKYLFQEGIPEYLSTTEYFIDSIVKENGTSNLYISITNNNIGNALSDTGNWKAIGSIENLIQATESLQGTAFIASQNEVDTGTDDTKIITPLKLQNSQQLFLKANFPVKVRITNNTVDSEHDLDFSDGNFIFDDQTGQASLSATTKRFDATFALGSGNGGMVEGQSLPANGAVFLFLISNSDGSITDIIGDTDKDGTNIASDSVIIANSLTKKKKLNAFMTDGTNNIRNGRYLPDGTFYYNTVLLDVTLSNPAIGETSNALTVPIDDLEVIGQGHANTGTTGADILKANFGSPNQTLTVLTGNDDADLTSIGDANRNARLQKTFFTNTAQVKVNIINSATSRNFKFKTLGYKLLNI